MDLKWKFLSSSIFVRYSCSFIFISSQTDAFSRLLLGHVSYKLFTMSYTAQVHGMPRIMGVLTHLDMIKKSDRLKRTKKLLKHRFWTEVYAGAKLFYLSGQIHGEYLRNEVKNLGRFISVMKFRPLMWRSTHPYFLGKFILLFN